MPREHPRDAEVERLRSILLQQAQFFDDPDAYAAGVEDAIDAVIELDAPAPVEDQLVPAGTWFG